MLNLMHDLYHMMDEEVEGAETYARKAVEYKEKMPNLAKTFDAMSADEMKHANLLEAEINGAIANEKKAGHTVPPEMDAIYNFMHGHYADKLAMARVMQAKYKGG